MKQKHHAMERRKVEGLVVRDEDGAERYGSLMRDNHWGRMHEHLRKTDSRMSLFLKLSQVYAFVLQ